MTISAKLFLQANHGWTPHTTYYLERSRAYLRAGEWDSAVDDFRRAKTGADFAMDDDRGGEITSSQNMQWYIDMRTLDDPRSGSAKVWVKEVHGSGDDAGAYSLQQYELNCGARARFVPLPSLITTRLESLRVAIKGKGGQALFRRRSAKPSITVFVGAIYNGAGLRCRSRSSNCYHQRMSVSAKAGPRNHTKPVVITGRAEQRVRAIYFC